jgi:hypothetical protein
LVAAACVAALLAFPALAGALSYGIADAPSSCASWGASSCNSWSYGFARYYGGGAFPRLKSALPLGYVPCFAPHDCDGQERDGVPAAPDPTAARAAGAAGVTTLAGQDYACGVQGLTYQTHVQRLNVAEWEAGNEPDAYPAYNSALNDACASLWSLSNPAIGTGPENITTSG